MVLLNCFSTGSLYSKGSIMPIIKTLIMSLALFVSGCSLNLDLTVHDEDKAAELTKQYFNLLGTESGILSSYKNSHEKLRETVPEKQFLNGMKNLYEMTQRATITLTAYETYGTEEAIAIYAHAIDNDKKLFFRATYLGTKSKGYKLLNFNGNDRGYEHKGIYKSFANPVIVQQI